MLKRYIQWGLVLGLFALLASQFVARPDWRAFLSTEYWESVLRFGRVLRLVESEFVHADGVSFEQLTDTALESAVRSLDPYSDYMIAQDYDAFNKASNQEYVGVGVEIAQFSGRVFIAQIFNQGSAQGSGLLVGDVIVEVDGEDVRGQSIGEVVAQVRGEPGSVVRLGVERPMGEAMLDFELERREIALASVVDVELLEDSVGYLKVRQFIDATDDEMVAAIRELDSQGAASLILDLRGNPGGRLDTAARMAEVFLEKGRTILTVQSRRGMEEVFRARGADFRYEKPLAVLIDGSSASASEILAGALRDHGRAVLVGGKTFGKGSVQSIFGFPGGDGLKLTSARYLLPGGDAINGLGVAPDVSVDLSEEEAYLRMLQRHHLRELSPEAFAAAFGFEPLADRRLEVARAILAER